MSNVTPTDSYSTVGLSTSRPCVEIFLPRDPTNLDLFGNGGPFQIQQRWWNTSTNNEWILVGFTSSNGVVSANWQPVSSLATTETLTGNTGGAVPPTNNNINVVGDGVTCTVAGDPSTSTLTISAIGSGVLETLTGNSGGTVSPDSSGNINTVGTGSITVVGDPTDNTLTAQLTGLTDHAVLVGGGTPTVTNVGPSATSGAIFLGKGSSADPAYSTTWTVNDGTGVAQGPLANTTQFPFYQINGLPFCDAFSFTTPAGVGPTNYYLTSAGTQSFVVCIQAFIGDYIQEIIVAGSANEFDFHKGTLSILSNYCYSGNSNQPITNVFWSYDSTNNRPSLTITMANVPTGGAFVNIAALIAYAGMQFGNFTPTTPSAIPSGGWSMSATPSTVGSAFGIGGAGSNFGIDPNANQNNLYISNGAVPSGTPTGGGILYVYEGGLYYLGTSGTTTPIATP